MISVFAESAGMDAQLEHECEREIEIGARAIEETMRSQAADAAPHLRCSVLFGWLCGRSPRSFRTFVYYAYRYWFSLRQAQLAGPDVHSFVRNAITAYATAPHTASSSEEFVLSAFRRLLACEASTLGLTEREAIHNVERAFHFGFRLATTRAGSIAPDWSTSGVIVRARGAGASRP